MEILLKKAIIFLKNIFEKNYIAIENNCLRNILSSISLKKFNSNSHFKNLYIIPGFINV